MNSRNRLRQKIRKIIEELEKEFPNIKPVISNADPLDVLIATILSQNTTDKTSYRAYMNLKKDFRSWNDVMNAPLARIKKSINVCGLSDTKSRNIKQLLKKIHDSNGKLSLKYLQNMTNDEIYDELLQYNGVGIKTVSCVLAFSLGRDVFPVDTHVHRLLNRFGVVKTNSPNETFQQASSLIPRGKKFLFHTLLIRFGRKICRAREPLCFVCRIYSLCGFEKKAYFRGRSKTMPIENNFIILENIG